MNTSHVVPTWILLKFTSWIYFIQRSPPLSFHLFCQLLKSRIQVSLTRKVSSYPDHLHCLLLQLEVPVLLLSHQPDVLPAPGETTSCGSSFPQSLMEIPASLFISVCILASHMQNGHNHSRSATSSAIPSPPSHLFPTHKLPICRRRLCFWFPVVWNFISFLGLQSLKSSTTIWTSFKKKNKSMENQGPCSKLPEEQSKGSVSACLDISYQGPLLSVFQTGNSPVEAHDTFSFTGWITFYTGLLNSFCPSAGKPPGLVVWEESKCFRKFSAMPQGGFYLLPPKDLDPNQLSVSYSIP